MKLNILVSRTDKIGDLLLSIPALSALSLMYPEAKIYCLVRRYNAPVVLSLDYIHEVIIIDEYQQDILIEKLKGLSLDLFIALFSSREIAFLARKSGAKKRIGPLSKLSSWISYNEGVYQKRSTARFHEADYNLSLVRKSDPVRFDQIAHLIDKGIVIPAREQEKVAQWISQVLSQPYIVIHPGCGGSAKNLTLLQYQAVVKEILYLYPHYDIVITGVATEKEQYQTLFSGLDKRVKVMCESENIMELAAIIQHAILYMGASTGPTHLAGALGKKIIAIFPPIQVQSKERWGVYKHTQRLYVEPKVLCLEKYRCTSKCIHYDCFDTISTSEIMGSIALILGE